MSHIKKNKLGFRVIGGLVLICFLVTQNAQAAELNFPLSSPSDASSLIQKDLPGNLGKIKSFHQGNGRGLVVHIQDAHSNLEIQQHIAGILGYLKSRHGIGLVHTEGSTGEIWHQFVSSHPNKEARALTADYFLREGLITGPEYEALTGSPDLVLHGVEDRGLYQSNRDIFMRTLEIQKRDLPILIQVRTKMDDVSRFMFPDNYRKLRQMERGFREDGHGFASYVRFLRDLLDQNGVEGDYPQIRNLAALSEAKESGKKAERMTASLGLDIFDEMSGAEEKLREKLLITEEARKLDGLFRVLSIYEKLFQLAWTKEDAEFFYNHPGSFKARPFKAELSGMLRQYGFSEVLPDLSFLDRDLPLMENFYSLALKRDQALVENAMKDMKDRGQNQSVLITGGFHTPGIEKALQKSGYSYIVIMPAAGNKIDEAEDREKYYKAMAIDGAPMTVLLKSPVQDPRFQLNPPSGFPTVDDLAKIPAGAVTNFDFRELVQNRRLGLALSGAVLNAVNALRLEGERIPSARIQMNVRFKGEEQFAPLFSAVSNPGFYYLDGNTGVLMTQPLGTAQISIKGYWHAEKKRDRNLVLRAEARALMSDGISVEIGLADPDDRAMLETKLNARREKTGSLSTARSEARTAETAGNLPRISDFSKMIYSPERTPDDDLLFLMGSAVDKFRAQIFDALKNEGITFANRFFIRAHHVLEDGTKTGKLEPGQVSTQRVYHMVFETPQGRKNFVLRIKDPQKLVTEVRATGKTNMTWNLRAYTPELNRLDNLLHNARNAEGQRVPVSTMFEAVGVKLPPYATIYVTPEKDEPVFSLRPENQEKPVMQIRIEPARDEALTEVGQPDQEKPEAVYRSEFLGETFILSVLLSPARALEMLRKLTARMKSGLSGFSKAGAQALGLKLYRRISGKDSSTVIGSEKMPKPASRSELRCGNASIQGEMKNSKDMEAYLSRLGQSIMITEVRGKISMGFYAVVEGSNGRKKVLLEKYIIWKRQQALDAFLDFSKKVRAAVSSVGYPSRLMIGVHLRWPTGGALEKDTYVEEIEAGAHPHQWLGINAITHNGDFDYLVHKGKRYSNDLVGWRLKRVLKKANNTTGDSPKAAGEFDLRLVQGDWKKVPRLAYDEAVVEDFKEYFGGKIPESAEAELTAPDTSLTPAEEQALSKFLETAFQKHGGVEILSRFPDLAKVDAKTIQGLQKLFLAEIHTAEAAQPLAIRLFNGWGPQKTERFIRTAVEAFFKNDSYNVWKSIMINFRGSAGINAYSPSSVNKLVAVSLISPIYIGFGVKDGLLQVGSFSERNAARVEGYQHILKLDPLGEVAEVSYENGVISIRVYSLSTGEELNLQQLMERGRIKDVTPFIPLSAEEKRDPIEAEHRKLPRYLEVVQKEWEGTPTREVPKPHNPHVAQEFASVLFRNPVGKRILNGVRQALERSYLKPVLKQWAASKAREIIGEDDGVNYTEELLTAEKFLTELYRRRVLASLTEKQFMDAVLKAGYEVSSGLIRGDFPPSELAERINSAVFELLEGYFNLESENQGVLEQGARYAEQELDTIPHAELISAINQAAGKDEEQKRRDLYRMQQRFLKPVLPLEIKGPDIVLYGKEKNEEHFNDWMIFFKKMLPDLEIVMLEPNHILEEAELATRSEEDASQRLPEMDIERLKHRLGLINPFVVALGSGESGQTFPSAVSTTLLVRMIPEVFVITADINSPMADDVGPRRTFLIRSGWSPAEVHVAATAATRLTFLEMGLYLTRAAVEKFPGERLFDRRYEADDLKEIERHRDEFLTSSIPNITGFTQKGKLGDTDVPDAKNLAEEGLSMGRRINESVDVWVLAAAYIFITVALPSAGVAISPLFTALNHLLFPLAAQFGAWYVLAGIAAFFYGAALIFYLVRKVIAMVSSKHPVSKRFAAKVFARTTTLVAVITGILFIPGVMDALLYIHLAGPVLPLLRRLLIKQIDGNKRSVQDRMGIKKIIIVSKNGDVANLLAIAMRKMFNQAYGINGVTVHATDSYRALDEHSGDRSTWIILLNRDGRVPAQENTESAVVMIGRQIKTILSIFFPFSHLFGIPLAGAYILHISSNPNPPGVAKGAYKHIVADADTHIPENMSKRMIVQEIYGDTVDAFKQLLAGFVLTSHIARAAATPVWYRPWSYVVAWVWYRTHGGTGVHTTAQPYGADAIVPYLQKLPKVLRPAASFGEADAEVSKLRLGSVDGNSGVTPSLVADALGDTPSYDGESHDPLIPRGLSEEPLEEALVVDGGELSRDLVEDVPTGALDLNSLGINNDPEAETPEAISEAADLLKDLFGDDDAAPRSELRDQSQSLKTLFEKLKDAEFQSLSAKATEAALRRKVEALKRNLKNAGAGDEKEKLQRRLVNAYVRLVTLAYLRQDAGPSREVAVHLIAYEMEIEQSLAVLAVLRAVNREGKNIFLKDLAGEFESAVSSMIKWPVIRNPSKRTGGLWTPGGIILENADAVKNGKLSELRVRAEVQPEFTRELPVGGSSTGPTLSTVIKTIVTNALTDAGYTDYQLSEPRNVYQPGPSGRYYVGMKGSFSFIPKRTRSELRLQRTELGQALQAKQDMMLQTILQAESAGADLLGALDNFAETTGIAAKFPAVLTGTRGQFIFDYRAEDHSLEFMKNLMVRVESQPREVSLVIFKDPSTSASDWDAVKKALGGDIRKLKASGRKVSLVGDDRFGSLESFVSYQAKQENLEMPAVMQFVDPQIVPSKARKYVDRALISAVKLARGRIVVAGSQKPIARVSKFAIERVITRTFQAMQAFGRSA